MYLPQFHIVEENSVWWGEGFTDWLSAKAAKPLFKGHYQPHIPLNDNYYDLLDVNTLKWQSELMKEYSVDGLCFYHYYFEKGKKILEKPAELLLENKDIDLPFCFCWANESWARSWSGVKDANAWNEVGEQESINTKSMLLRQAYGQKQDWIEHFYYLLPFFLDDRYIKIDGKPLFVIYKTGLIDCLKEMLECWNQLAADSGIKGIYIIGNMPTNSQRELIDGELYHEPVRSNTFFIENQYVNKAKNVSYDELWNKIIKDVNFYSKKTYYGGFVSYDDTPRRGERGIVVTGATPEAFKKYIAILMKKNWDMGNEITFINAWNEWGEGMHLEPDDKYKYGFLEAIKEAKDKYVYEEWEKNNRDLEYEKFLKNRSDKFELYLNDIDVWMSLKERNVGIVNFLKNNDYKRVGIYGYGIMGRHLLTEISDNVYTCVIDQQKDKIRCDAEVFLPHEIPNLDVVIVASYYYFHEICDHFDDKVKIVSLGDIIHKLWSSV